MAEHPDLETVKQVLCNLLVWRYYKPKNLP